MASANTNQNLKNLPVDVIPNIMQFLPTKKAIQLCLLSKDWKGLWSSFSVLDFEEGDQVHEVFINFLLTCLNLQDEDKNLDIFRLSMRVCSDADEGRVRKVLRFAVEKRVKELEISLKYQNALLHNTLFNGNPITSLNLENVTTEDSGEPLSLPFLRSMSLENVNFKGLPFNKLMHGVKSLTSLKLKRLKLDANTFQGPYISFPSLRTMSFQHVHLKTDLHFIEHGCPSLECLSFSDCSGYDGSTLLVLQVANSSLKSLEITNCNVKGVQVFRSTNLKSFSLVSESPHLQKVGLYSCKSLTCLNIHEPHLKELVLYGCGDSVEATFNTPSLFEFTFRGYLDCAVPLRAPNLFIVFIELWDKEPGFGGVLEHYTALRAYLETFDCCSGNIFLGVHDAETLIFPESFRDTCSAPLPSLKRIKVFIKLHQEASESDLKDSLSWLAPSAAILPVVYDEPHYLWYGHKQKLIKDSGFLS